MSKHVSWSHRCEVERMGELHAAKAEQLGLTRPAWSRRLDQRPPEVHSNLTYSAICVWPQHKLSDSTVAVLVFTLLAHKSSEGLRASVKCRQMVNRESIYSLYVEDMMYWSYKVKTVQ